MVVLETTPDDNLCGHKLTTIVGREKGVPRDRPVKPPRHFTCVKPAGHKGDDHLYEVVKGATRMSRGDTTKKPRFPNDPIRQRQLDKVEQLTDEMIEALCRPRSALEIASARKKLINYVAELIED